VRIRLKVIGDLFLNPALDVFLLESPVCPDLKSRDLAFAGIPVDSERMKIKVVGNLLGGPNLFVISVHNASFLVHI